MGFIHAHESGLIFFLVLVWVLLAVLAWALIAGGAASEEGEDDERRHEWGSDWKHRK